MASEVATLALEDGAVFYGRAFGAPVDGYGEVCFNTSMTGYQEILTDPSYAGQMICMTAPQIGNTGVNALDMESRRAWAGGFIVREICPTPSNFRSTASLDSFLKKWGVPGIAGIDTRALTKRLRDFGAKRGVLLRGKVAHDLAVKRARSSPAYVGVDWISKVSTPKAYTWDKPLESGVPGVKPSEFKPAAGGSSARLKVITLDCGVKYNSLRNLVSHGAKVTVVPARTTAAEILAAKPDGVFISNGPGDPNAVPYLVETVRRLIAAKVPLFGICMGHQMLTLALGGRMAKLKFGHRGGNQPVRDESTKKVEITSQNHGFATVKDSFTKDKDVVLSHWGLNDQVVEGLRHKRHALFSVQYHPEASPGPHDANYLFGRFVRMMQTKKPLALK